MLFDAYLKPVLMQSKSRVGGLTQGTSFAYERRYEKAADKVRLYKGEWE
jgi:hypothetical protein